MSQIVIAVAGTIGSGKTTLTQKLAEKLCFVPVFEPHATNPYLDDFYRDMPRFALPTQLRFLLERLTSTHRAIGAGASAVLDRTCFEDAEIFAAMQYESGLMSARDHETYSMAAGILLENEPAPSLLVFLDRSLQGSIDNVHKRGREMERGVDVGYLETLHQHYLDWFARYHRGPKLRLDANQYDILEREEDWHTVFELIVDALPQRALF